LEKINRLRQLGLITKKSSGKVLIVDDDVRILRVLNDILIPNGYDVLLAKNGREAIEIVRKEIPDLILMDIMMPVTDGYTACSIIKSDKITSHIPLIMLTGIGFELNKKLGEQLKADGYLVKPVSIENLLDTVRKFLEK
jgi:CheY-like chemotaxis protein